VNEVRKKISIVSYVPSNVSRVESAKDDHELDSARNLFSRFHCFPSAQVIWEPCPRVIPRILVQVGELRGLIYRSDKGQKGRPRTFIHFMKTPPRLACDPNGRQLYIIGGDYRVTAQGING